MRKLLIVGVLAVLGAVLANRLRSGAAASARPSQPATLPHPQGSGLAAGESAPETEAVDPPVTEPPPPTTNGERVVLMSIWSLQERGQDATREAVVSHVAAGEIDPDEGTVEVLLQRLVRNGCLADGSDAPYHLTALGQGALLDGSGARRSPAGDAAEELSSPTTTA